MATTPSQTGYQARTTPAERRADIDNRRLSAGLEASVSELEDRVSAVEDRLAVLEDYVYTWVGSTLRYSYNVNTAMPPPQGQVRMNNASPAAATIVRFHYVTDDSVDARNFFKVLTNGGDRFMIQDKNNALRVFVYDITADPVDTGTDISIAVACDVGMSGSVAFTSPQPSIVAFRHAA